MITSILTGTNEGIMGKGAKLIRQLQAENSALNQRIQESQAARCVSHEDTLMLQILDGSPFTVWACTADLKIVLWNKTCERVYGFTKAEAIGKSFVDLFVSNEEK